MTDPRADEMKEPIREKGKHRFMAGTCVDCGHPFDEICTANLNISPIPEERAGEEATTTWVPVYVERAICDLIPDTGYAREIARKAWAWDDEHVGYENSLYKWQNEAIRQRRDLIALQELIEHEQNPYPELAAQPSVQRSEDKVFNEGIEAASVRICFACSNHLIDPVSDPPAVFEAGKWIHKFPSPLLCLANNIRKLKRITAERGE